MSQRRKAHRKSRNGCYECKRRRIKCDEFEPRCTQCTRHESTCVYPSSKSHSGLATAYASPAISAKPQSSQAATPHSLSSPGAVIPSSITSDNYFSLHDLALLHHWTLSTSKSILQTPQLDHLWQSIFPSIGFQHAYVIHSILSIASLHDSHLHPENRRQRVCDATHHHTLALQGFRQAIDSVGPHNADALFASANLAFFYAFLTFGTLHDGEDNSTGAAKYTARVLGEEWIPLTRGLATILETVREHVQSGPLRSLLEIGNWFEVDPDTQSESEEDIQMKRLEETWQGSENAQVYDKTLYMLRRTNAWMKQFQSKDQVLHDCNTEGYNRGWAGPFIWVFMVPEKFFELQKQRQPQALLLFAYYGVLLQQLDNYWWMRGCGKSIVLVVDKCLGSYWSSWMTWPKEAVDSA